MGTYMLILLLLTAAPGWAQTCYRPGGAAADYRYVPCNTGEQSMCCRTNDNNYPDKCRTDGLCQETLQDVIWRESCTDPTWQSPQCLRLCIDGVGFGNDSIVTFCPDQSICCGYQNMTCCGTNEAVWISNGQVVTTSPGPSAASSGPSATSPGPSATSSSPSATFSSPLATSSSLSATSPGLLASSSSLPATSSSLSTTSSSLLATSSSLSATSSSLLATPSSPSATSPGLSATSSGLSATPTGPSATSYGPSATSQSVSSGNVSRSMGAKIGIGVAVPLVAIIIAVSAAFIYIRRRRSRNAIVARGNLALEPLDFDSEHKAELIGTVPTVNTTRRGPKKPELDAVETSVVTALELDGNVARQEAQELRISGRHPRAPNFPPAPTSQYAPITELDAVGNIQVLEIDTTMPNPGAYATQTSNPTIIPPPQKGARAK